MLQTPSGHPLLSPTKGILAIDESEHTSQTRFAAHGLVSTLDSRTQWRSAILATPNLSDYLSGIIVVEETLPLLVALPGIAVVLKIDQGLTDRDPHSQPVTNGLSTLSERLQSAIASSPIIVTATKWRVVLYPSRELTDTLSESTRASLIQLAQYAMLVQRQGLIPVIEPEIIIVSSDTLDHITHYTHSVMTELAVQLASAQVNPSKVVLKMGFVYSTTQAAQSAQSARTVGSQTAAAISAIAASVSGVVFLSGGLNGDQSAAFLTASHEKLGMVAHTYSFGRAIQDDAFALWCRDSTDITAVQQAITRQLQRYQQAISTPR
jgi:fructose-bisphosphate aldolase, class I